jgi:voltage-gated potassium channel
MPTNDVVTEPRSTTSATEPPQAGPPRSPYRTARRYVYELLLTPDIETRVERFVRGAITILIVANVLMVVLETVPAIHARMARAFHVAEVVSVAIFTLEYLLRLWAAVENPRFARPLLGRLRFMLTFFALVDLVAILPFYLPHFIKADMRFVRGLRLFRLMRVFKLGRFSDSLTMYGRIFRDKRHELLVSMALLCLILLMASSLMYFLEHEAQPQHFSSIPAAMWWGIITLTTIGYGDVYPVTALGRVFGSIIAVIGIGFVALPSAILVAGIMEQIDLKRKRRQARAAAAATEDAGASPAAPAAARCPHCGRSPEEPRAET